MLTLICTTAGTALLLVVAYDVYSTVLHASARYGPIGERLNRIVWRMARLIAVKLSRPRRHKLLNVVGPLLMPLLVIIFLFALVVGFALIYFPRMPADFTHAFKIENPAWLDSIYFSGVTLTSMGYGDIVRRTTAMRFTAMLESAWGLLLISLVIAYLITIYRALERKRAIALSIYHQAGEGADAAGYIAYHFVEGKFYGLRQELRAATSNIQELLEAHIEHPVIHYFHPVEVYKGLPRMLFILLETCTIIRTALDAEEYSDLCNFPEVRTLDANTRQVLVELVDSLDLERRERARDEERPLDRNRWAKRFARNVESLKEVGIKTRADGDKALDDYSEQRKEWEAKLQRLSNHLGYDWDEVTGDSDPDYAVNEEKEEPQGAPQRQ